MMYALQYRVKAVSPLVQSERIDAAAVVLSL
jgi:hypothetical protein